MQRRKLYETVGFKKALEDYNPLIALSGHSNYKPCEEYVYNKKFQKAREKVERLFEKFELSLTFKALLMSVIENLSTYELIDFIQTKFKSSKDLSLYYNKAKDRP